MSYSNALHLLRLADLAASRHMGITLDQVCEEFDCSPRTAQRMMRALEEAFPNSIFVMTAEDRRRRWRLQEVPIARLRLRGPDELEALEAAIDAMQERGDERHADLLSGIRDRLLAALPPQAARAAETDADALLEAYGMAARPGPVVTTDRELSEAVAHALRGPWRIRFNYNGENRIVEPYGVLIGPRRYLVARQPAKDDTLRHFRFDRISDVVVTEEWFAKDPEFSISKYATRAFGAYQNEAEFAEVVWVFSAEAADRAAEWLFHPTQTTRRLPDGRLEVRFTASGWLEMAWHLQCWGNSVKVVAPEGLKSMMERGPEAYSAFP
jgi:predicted DNA-binding transcriptional regulator YafY